MSQRLIKTYQNRIGSTGGPIGLFRSSCTILLSKGRKMKTAILLLYIVIIIVIVNCCHSYTLPIPHSSHTPKMAPPKGLRKPGHEKAQRNLNKNRTNHHQWIRFEGKNITGDHVFSWFSDFKHSQNMGSQSKEQMMTMIHVRHYHDNHCQNSSTSDHESVWAICRLRVTRQTI